MDLVENLISFFKSDDSKESDHAPDGYCPNCWGEQEYGNVIRELYKDKQIDVNNDQANYTFIRKFVVTRIDGIHLIKGESSLDCPTCKTKFNFETND